MSVYFLCVICVKYFKPSAVQYYITDCVSWLPGLTLLDLGTNWTYERSLRTDLVHMKGTYIQETLEVVDTFLPSSP